MNVPKETLDQLILACEPFARQAKMTDGDDGERGLEHAFRQRYTAISLGDCRRVEYALELLKATMTADEGRDLAAEIIDKEPYF